MGYSIEVSYNVRARRNNNNELFEDQIRSMTEKYNSTTCYSLHECDGNSANTLIMKQVIVVSFEYDNIEDCAKFIREIKKTPFIYIECVYEDETIYKLLYASTRYLKKLDKTTSREFKKTRKNNNYSETEKILLKELFCVKK